MDYKKKLKRRMWLSICFIIIGVAILTADIILKPETNTLESIGFYFTLFGISYLFQYLKAKKNYSLMKKLEIEENDERNIMINQKSLALAAKIFIFIALIAATLLSYSPLSSYGSVIYTCICTYILIYLICYNVFSRKL